MPFALQYSISTLLYPVAVSQISFRFFAALRVDSFNGALLAMYLNSYMKNEIGKSRGEWTLSDYDNAYQKLPVIREYIERALSEYLRRDE